jgi:hypothetical protein
MLVKFRSQLRINNLATFVTGNLDWNCIQPFTPAVSEERIRIHDPKGV